MNASTRRTGQALVTVALGGALTAALIPAASAASADTPAAGAPASADAKPPAGLQAAADRLVADGQPGVIVMTRRGNKVAHVTSGVADRATGTPMDPRMHTRIASVTKTYTSTVVLQLAGERRLSLNDPVAKWLPGVLTRNGNDGRKITIRQLLAQRSGLNEFALDPRVQTQPTRTWKPRELVDIAQEKAPQYRPGHGWNYSNTNYILAGMIVEKVTHHSFGTELQRRIIKPLKLRHTSLPVASMQLPKPYVHGYFGDYGDVSTAISPSSGWTSGGMVSTVDDVARFHRALYTGRLLTKRMQREMTTARPVTDDWVKEDYGLGAARTRFSCGFGWGHDGGWPGYRTWTYTSADGKRQAVITYNGHNSTIEADKTFQSHLKKAAEVAFCS
ncbi:beta-lactamase family protein [Actinomadura barringtoniae]|uniref:Beta-lactamase family protein n=1 Tax=Actinomadura barringtoniae TaxID=1427535 RepID=A0A939PMK9_9ACTN|nr:serine hydrolase domain-containing protein [Actinomadura barringtoniae]MBO2455561.1 beta-lactamase family protein [Actinomadura barringtoniae]